MAKSKEYRALVGMDFTNENGNDARVEAGDKIEGMPEDEVKHQVNKGNAEVWRDRKTENVRSGDQGAYSYGVTSRHANDGADIVLKTVEEVDDDE